MRSDEDKTKVSWTHALRTIVKNCYKHHAREDLLPEFSEDKDKDQQLQHTSLLPTHTVVQTVANDDGTFSLIQVDTGNTVATLTDVTQVQQLQAMQGIQLQPIQIQQPATQGVQTLAEVASQQGVVTQVSQSVPVTVQLTGPQRVATLATATLPAGTQIMLSNGTVGTISAMSEGIVIPTQVYQTVTQVETSEGTVMHPIQVQGGQVITTQAGAHLAALSNGTAGQSLKMEADMTQQHPQPGDHGDDGTQVIAMPMVTHATTSQAAIDPSQQTVEIVPMDH